MSPFCFVTEVLSTLSYTIPRVLRQLAVHQEAGDKKVDSAKDRVASEVFDMCLVVEPAQNEGRTCGCRLYAAQDHCPLPAQLFPARVTDGKLRKSGSESPDTEGDDGLLRRLECGYGDSDRCERSQDHVDVLCGGWAGAGGRPQVIHGTGDVPERIEDQKTSGQCRTAGCGCDDDTGPE